MAGVKYDPAIIRKHAEGLYDWAAAIVTAYTFVMATLGFGATYLLANWQPGRGGLVGYPLLAVAIVIGFVGGVIGYLMGESRASGLRLQAQIALCQVQIEENTRRS